MKILDKQMQREIDLKRYVRNTKPDKNAQVTQHITAEFQLCFYVQGTCVFSQGFSKDRIIFETLTIDQILRYIQGVVKHAST